MNSALHFYFDFTSPYGYLGAMKIEELANKYSREVEWHPVLLGVIFKATGMVPIISVPLKGKYSQHDLMRSARFHQIPFAFPSEFPISTQNTARAMLVIANKWGKESAVKFAKAAYKAYFVDGINISDVANIVQIAGQQGLAGDFITEKIASQEIKDQLRVEVESAQSQGVFGSPFIIVDNEPFWGLDRFDQVEALLKYGKI